MHLEFSVHSPNGGMKEVSRIRERVVRAEQLGFEGVYLGSSQLSTPEPFQVLACCAVATSRIKLGTAVTNMVYQEPTVLAGSAATLSEISDGRAVLGLGTGDGPVYAMGRKATRLKEFEEGIRTIRVLLQGGVLETPTSRVRVNYRLVPAPVYLSMEGPARPAAGGTGGRRRVSGQRGGTSGGGLGAGAHCGRGRRGRAFAGRDYHPGRRHGLHQGRR